MPTQTLVPTTMEPQAADFVAKLGLQASLAEMVDHLKQNVPDLRKVAVEYAPAYDTGCDGILIHALRDSERSADQGYWEQFSAWKVARFSPDVWRHFNLILSCDDQHGR